MFKMLKPYKEEKPLITVNKIRSILNDIGIFVSEEYEQKGDFFNCRIEILNDALKKFCIGTNGKGRSLEFAYASAYAEFMERLQNNILIKETFFFSKYYKKNCSFKKQLKLENNELDFLFCPDEKIVETSKVVDDNFEILSKLLPVNKIDELEYFIIKTLGFNKLFCVPFFNLRNKRTDYLPIELFFQSTGSTGMCAGNTPEEALVQGISEIIERYSIIQIYSNKITPPTIPHEYFKEYPIYNVIKKIESKGLEIIIKDFSLGKKLPVIGVIIIDKYSRKYNVKVGADPWPVIALERCLTELHQNFNGIRLINKSDFGNYLEDYIKIDNEEALHINLTKILDNARGQWPDEIFSDNYTYKFHGLNFDLGKSNKSDLHYLLQLIEELDSQILIRDVSFLGFYSYYVIAPGLSQDKKSISDYRMFNKLYSAVSSINNISLLSKDKLTSIISILEEYYVAIKKNYLDFKEMFIYNIDDDATDLTLDLFLSMSNYKLGNVNKAYIYLNNFLIDKDVENYIYFYACKDYLVLLGNGKNSYDIQSYLTKIYNIELAKEVIEDMRDAENIFKSYNLQSYFDCNYCNIEEFKYYKIAPILKNIEEKHKTNPINQMNLSKIFC